MRRTQIGPIGRQAMDGGGRWDLVTTLAVRGESWRTGGICHLDGDEAVGDDDPPPATLQEVLPDGLQFSDTMAWRRARVPLVVPKVGERILAQGDPFEVEVVARLRTITAPVARVVEQARPEPQPRVVRIRRAERKRPPAPVWERSGGPAWERPGSWGLAGPRTARGMFDELAQLLEQLLSAKAGAQVVPTLPQGSNHNPR